MFITLFIHSFRKNASTLLRFKLQYHLCGSGRDEHPSQGREVSILENVVNFTTVNDMLRGTVKEWRRFQEHCFIVSVNWPFKTLHENQANLKGSYALLKYGTLEILVCKYGCYTQLSQAELGKSGSLWILFPSAYSFFVSRLAVRVHMS